MTNRASAEFERSRRMALAEIQHYRHEVERRRTAGGYDPEALQWVETYCDNCTEALNQGDVAMLLVWHASLIKHLVWARNPLLKDEALRERQRANAKPGQFRSQHKPAAVLLYREADPKPETCEEFERMLDREGIPYPEGGAGKWYTEARKHPQT